MPGGGGRGKRRKSKGEKKKGLLKRVISSLSEKFRHLFQKILKHPDRLISKCINLLQKLAASGIILS
jgi:hypothetical protein